MSRRVDPRTRPALVALVVLFAFFAVALHDNGFTSSDNLHERDGATSSSR